MIRPEEKKRILEEIAAANGGILKPEDVVAAATSVEHPLHGEFEWDNEKAAHAHRIEQARTLIRSVRIEVKTTKRTLETVFYVRDPSAEAHEGGYVSLPRLLSDKEKAAAAIAQEFARAQSALERARNIATALGIEPQIDKVLGHVRELAEDLPSLVA